MIQRIQSFWLVLAACCMALCFMTPVAEYSMEIASMEQTVEAELNLFAKDAPDMMEQMFVPGATVTYSQKMSGFQTWPLTVLAILVGVVALVSVFFYRNRVAQMRVVAVAFLLNVVYVFLVFFWAVDAYAKIVEQAMNAADPQVTWYVGAYAPIVSLVFLVLAHRGYRLQVTGYRLQVTGYGLQMKLEIHSLEQLPEVARKLLNDFSDERFFAFFGKMGVGKTTLIKELCAALGVKDNVCSPTFAIVNEYSDRVGEPVYHFDFYRLKSVAEAYDIGYEEYFYSGCYCFTEWTEKVEELLPERYVRVDIEERDGKRILTAAIQ